MAGSIRFDYLLDEAGTVALEAAGIEGTAMIEFSDEMKQQIDGAFAAVPYPGAVV